ncbi:PLP-dependent aminotransferase family protein [Pantoea sp. 1.19]|uniref:aminotransferase-like domain-containing protein n=1 Tax=Pantoea sp. 1.19 TaxID=1925589 RepID=UPI000948FD44|nr:PLP-dependent aminotransferase family protein [Pantoea sp. 1.19]
MAKYQQLVARLRQQIEAAVWSPGEKLPSLREQATRAGMSLMTVMHAYQVLESQGYIQSRPQSGYYVANRRADASPQARRPEPHYSEAVDINAFIFEVLQACRDPQIVPFGSAFPDPGLLPQRQLLRALNRVSREMRPEDVLNNLPPGNLALRQTLSRRYARQGITVPAGEIVITNGALEALNLSLQAVTEPGDWVVIEHPCFYGAWQAIERLRLKAVAVASDPREGIDLDELARVLATRPVKACWLMTSQQNPLGCTLSADKKRALVALLSAHRVRLIEDDVYSELWHGEAPPLPARAYDREGTVLHCSSFSKSLVAGFRVGWVAAGPEAPRIQRLQFSSTLSTSAPLQQALAHYLESRGFESHLRRLRETLAQRKCAALQALRRHLPPAVTLHDAPGGYFLWLTLPPRCDALALYNQALTQQISLAPGRMFSPDPRYHSGFRLNVSRAWDARSEAAAATLGALIRAML